MKEDKRKHENRKRRERYWKKRGVIVYSLERIYMKGYIIDSAPSAEEVYEKKMLMDRIFSVLTEKQASRVFKNIYLCMNIAQIAEREGVDEGSVRLSIKVALKKLKKFIKNS